MKIIEFLGIARAGKTTTAKYLEGVDKNVIFHPERHDLIPKSMRGDNYKHNLWYANYCIRELNNILDESKVHLFERGLIDRVIIGNVYYKMGWFSKEQWEEYNTLLTPYIEKINEVFVFLTSVEESAKRARVLGKDVTKAIPYMKNLYEEYRNLKEWFPRVTYLPEKATPEKLQDITAKAIFG